jgi:hypothetical protein
MRLYVYLVESGKQASFCPFIFVCVLGTILDEMIVGAMIWIFVDGG